MKLILLSILAIPCIAMASSPTSYCQYETNKYGSAKYSLSDAYKSADFVIIGQTIRNDKVKVLTTIKPKQNPIANIYLEGKTCEGTACKGFSLPTGYTFLMLLAKTNKNDTYSKVDPGDKCPNIFEIVDGQAIIGNENISLKKIEDYLGKNKTIDY